MKNLKFDYGQPLAIVALLLVLSTAFAFFEEPIPPPKEARPLSGTDLKRPILDLDRHEKAKKMHLPLNGDATADLVHK